MAAIALEEKINKIKLQNEEIKRRHEEVEADKKNAAKLNALVQMVPSSDWPERKEPPEFANTSNRPTSTKEPKAKPTIKENYYAAGTEGKTMHKFADGDGPPPDPKYNFLADSERDNTNRDNVKEEEKKKDRNKFSRGGGSKRRGGGRDSFAKEYHSSQAPSRKEAPEYEAWRAERNRIDEARINRQKTAEGNWRREWDNNKIIEAESIRKDARTAEDDFKREHDKRFYHDGEHSNFNRTNDSSFQRSFKNSKKSYGSSNAFPHQNYSKTHYNPQTTGNSEKGFSEINRNIKTVSNRGSSTPKGPVMSVRVNSPNIAGTGRVGPRQKTKFTYSTVSEGDMNMFDNDRSKFFDDKHNGPKQMPPKSPFMQRKDQSSTYKNVTPKGDKILLKKDFKDNTRPQRQVGIQNMSKRSGLEGRLERVRSENDKSVKIDTNVEQVVAADELENEIKVVSESEQFHLNNEDNEKTVDSSKVFHSSNNEICNEDINVKINEVDQQEVDKSEVTNNIESEINETNKKIDLILNLQTTQTEDCKGINSKLESECHENNDDSKLSSKVENIVVSDFVVDESTSKEIDVKEEDKLNDDSKNNVNLPCDELKLSNVINSIEEFEKSSISTNEGCSNKNLQVENIEKKIANFDESSAGTEQKKEIDVSESLKKENNKTSAVIEKVDN